MRLFPALILVPVFLASAVYISDSQVYARALSTTLNSAGATDSYGKEPYVFERLEHRVRFEADGTGQRETYFRLRVQSESAVREFGLLRYPFASSFEALEIDYVRVTKPDGSVHDTPASDIQELDTAVSREAPMYTDEREKHVAVKSLAVGDILEAHLVWKIHDAVAPGHFWFDQNFFRHGICLQEKLWIDVPAQVPVILRKSEVQPEIKDEKGRRIYLFQRSNLVKVSDESKIPEWERNFHGAPSPEIGISSFANWQQVGDWFRSISQDKAAPSADVKATAEEVTKGLDTEDARIRALYKYVSTRFRYIGIDLGHGRYIPHSAAEVMVNRYGDCKDKETLFAALLQASGIASFPVLISSHYRIDPTFPSVAAFNHIITAIPQGDSFLLLDTTPEIAPFGLLSPLLRDRQALVIPATEPARLINTPPHAPFSALERFHMESSIDDGGTLEGKARIEERGDSELLMRTIYHGTPQNRWQEFTQRLASGLGFAGSVSDVVVADPEETNAPFSIDFSYRRTDYPEWRSYRITLPTPPIFLPVLTEEQKLSADPLPLGALHELIYEASLKIPAQYTVMLPPKVEKKVGFAEFAASYSFENDVLRGTFRLKTLKREIPGVDRGRYSTFVSDVGDAMRRYIFLGKQQAAGKEVKTSKPGSSDHQPPDSKLAQSVAVTRSATDAAKLHEADPLYEAAQRAANSRNYADAARLLEEVVAKNPEHKSAWNFLGWTYNSLLQYEKAEAALRRDIQINPLDPSAYNNLGNALVGQKKYEEAVPQFLKQIEIKPRDQWSHVNLANAYMHIAQYEKASGELETAATITPKDPAVYFGLARSYAKQGKIDKAVANYQLSIDLDPTPNRWNAVAYEMAVDKVDLDRAQVLAEKAVADVSDRLNKISLDHLSAGDVRLPASLGAYWDTLGWIAFQKNQLPEAEKYVRCSWQLRTIGVIGDHLGQIYEKQGHRDEALAMYAKALTTDFPIPETNDRLRALLGPAEDSKPLIEQAKSDLSKTRQVQIKNATSSEGLAEFWLVLESGGKPSDARFISGDETMRRSAADLKAAVFSDPFPVGGSLKLLRRVKVVCAETRAPCTVRFVSAESVQGLN